MRILVCGSRTWTDYGMIFNVVVTLRKLELIIEGGAKGADALARKVAQALNIPVLTFYADWEIYGNAAGPIRNKKMLEEGKPDLVLAFHDNLSRSKGTYNLMTLAQNAGVPVWFYSHRGGQA